MTIVTDHPALIATRARRAGILSGALGLAALLIALLVIVPIATVAVNLVHSTDLMAHLAATVLPGYVINTIWMMLGVPLATIIIGTGAAWLVTMCSFPGRRIFEWALILPLAAPAYVLAYTYTDFLQHSGPLQTALRDLTGWGPRDYWFPNIRSLPGAISLFALTLYPYVYLLARAAFLEQSVCVLEASRTLGEKPWGAFTRVALPLARPAIATGAALALMETLADFGTVSYFGVQTFTTGIYRALYSFADRVAAAQLASGLLGFVILVLAVERYSRGRRRFNQTTGVYRPIRRFQLTGIKAACAWLFCALPLALGFIVPAILLIVMTIQDGHALFGARYVQLVWNSVSLATVTACIAVALAIVLAYANRHIRRPFMRGATRVAATGYAIPGSIIAVGILLPLAAFDNWLDGVMNAAFGLSTGLLLTGTGVALVYAYLVRFLAVSLQTAEASLAKITPSMDEAARTLGRGPWRTATEVHAPLMAGSLMTAGLIVFVDVMKELPATMILRPFNFDTLAVQAYNLAKDERLTQASTASLMIVAVGVIPLIFLSRRIARSRPGDRIE